MNVVRDLLIPPNWGCMAGRKKKRVFNIAQAIFNHSTKAFDRSPLCPNLFRHLSEKEQ